MTRGMQEPRHASPTAERPAPLRGDKPLKWRDRFLIAVVSFLGAASLRLLRLFLRLEIRGQEAMRAMWARGENAVIVFWHGRFLLLPFSYGGPGAFVLISSSRDGELIARTIQKLGLDTVRGSSTRGGEEARERLLTVLREGYDVGITPDGPKGPRHVVKAGAVELAMRSGRPIVPVIMASARGRRLSSWDRFLLPVPFDRVVLQWGEPMWIKEDEDFEIARKRVEQYMMALMRRADAETGNPEPED